MKRFLLLSLLALPLCAQYPAGAVFQRGDDPRWADPNFDDRQWVKQSEYRANSYDDYLQNRSWMRARVTIPAGEPAVRVGHEHAVAVRDDAVLAEEKADGDRPAVGVPADPTERRFGRFEFVLAALRFVDAMGTIRVYQSRERARLRCDRRFVG